MRLHCRNSPALEPVPSSSERQELNLPPNTSNNTGENKKEKESTYCDKEYLRTLYDDVILSSLSCTLSSKSEEKNDKAESYAKIQTSNRRVRISGKNNQSFFTSTDGLQERVNISSDYNPLTPVIQESNANSAYTIETAFLKNIQTLLKKEKEDIATDVLPPRDSDGITAKETNQTGDGIQHKFLNVSCISESSAIIETAAKERECKENKRTGNKLDQVKKFFAELRNNTDIKNSISKSLSNMKNSTFQRVKFLQEQNDEVQTNKDFKNDDTFIVTEEYFTKESNESSIRMAKMVAKKQNTDLKIENQTLGTRTVQKNWEFEEDDLTEAANFGLQAMHNLYYVQEPKLYSMGLYLESDNPARYIAAFNDQSEEARNLAKFGYAALQGTAIFLKTSPNTSLESPLSRSKFTRQTLLKQQCPRRNPPECPPASLRYRTSDGSCNNLQNLWWGSAMSTMQRFLPPQYHDGVQSIRRSKNGGPLPSARDVTSLIHENKDIPLASITHMLMQWGQFVDHDLTATGQSRGFNGTVPQCCLRGGIGFQPPEFMHPECLPIAINLHDSFYGPLGVRCLEFLRSGPAPKEDCEFGPREQLSQVTSYLDASMVYSSNAMHSDSLRIFRNGLLQYGKLQSRKPLLPKRESDLCKRGSLSTTCFRAGDGRLSEQPALTSLHVVFLRLHNRIATELSALNSHWSDEKVFQETRRIVGAVVQHITYREFLPIILGPQVMKIFDLEILKKGYYEGYDSTINPTVANSFSTAAYRFGHSLVQQSFVRFDSDHRPMFNNVSIHDEFSNPVNLETAGSVDRLLLGLVNQPCQRRDEFITEEMTNHLFQTPGFAFGMDLASLNIQRGRDHGLPAYVRWREPCSLSPIRSFEDLNKVMSPVTARKFKSLYSSVEDIDLFSAGLAEKSVIGGLVGPTFACIIGQQFSNLRRGDRFWYENPESESSFTAGQLQQIRQVTLAQILCRTMDGIETIQPFVFLATDTLKNQRLSCDDPIGNLDLKFWTEQPSEFRNNSLQKTKRTTTDENDPISRSKGGNANQRRKDSNHEVKITSQKPLKSGINQDNRIVVKRPFGRPDDNNFTIMVQNNAVNAPVFVNEGIYGSRINIQQQPVARPISNPNQAINSPTVQRPQTKPIPTIIPHSASFHSVLHPYVPYAFNDPSNPNPLAYGYRSPAFVQDDILYDNYSPISPRPTLYTYYPNFQQKATTQMSDHKVDGYLINYGPHSLPAPIYESPKPPINSGHYYELNNEQKPAQNPNYDRPKLSANARPNFRPNYTSNEESYQMHKPSYDGYKTSTITRPNFRPIYEYDEPYYEQRPNYNRPKPTANPKPNNDIYHAQKTTYGFITNLRPDSKPNYPPQNTRKPNDAQNPYLQNDDLNNEPNENYFTNPNKPQHQEQWDSNDYQRRPSEKPYSYNNHNTYWKRPIIKSPNYNISGLYQTISIDEQTNEYNSQFGKKFLLDRNSAQSELYGSVPSSTLHNTPYNQESRFTGSNNSPPANRNDYNPYSTTTPIYQKTSPTTQSSQLDVSSYVTESSTGPLQSNSNSSPFYQKSTSYSIYQKNDQSQRPFYSKEASDRFITKIPYENDDPNKKLTKLPDLNDQLLSSTPYWSETSTINSQIHRQEGSTNLKPTKVQSVTIVTETIGTLVQKVHHLGQTGFIFQHKVTSEIPRPLSQQIKNNVPDTKKPGQYYYEKNVLHRYPDEIVDQIPKSNHHVTDESEKKFIQNQEITSEETAVETLFTDDPVTNSGVIDSDESKLNTTPTLTIAGGDIDGDTVGNFQRAFSADVESVVPTDALDRLNLWVNSQEDLNLPLISEMPEMPSDEFTSAKELPKPIKSRIHVT